MSPLRPSPDEKLWAFSLVEVIIGLVILAFLAGITISFYEDSSSRAKDDTARARLATLADGLKRWELQYRRDYPYRDLGPLAGRFIDAVGSDPWGSAFGIDLDRGFVYSPGPNTTDERGDGDDIRFPFRTPRITQLPGALTGGQEARTTDTQRALVMVAPAAPRNLVFSLSNQKLTWRPPATFSDGSPLTPTEHLQGYRIYLQSSDGVMRMDPGGVVARSATEFSVAGAGGKNVSQVYTVRAYYLDQAGAAVESADSNQAGVYVPQVVAPVITRFEPSTYNPPVGNRDHKFTFHFEIFDADSNLWEVKLNLGGVPGSPFTVWPPDGKAASAMPNRFQVSNLAWQPTVPDVGFTLTTTGPLSTVELTASDRSQDGSSQTTTARLQSPVVVTNSPPILTNFRADRTAIIKGSSPQTAWLTSVFVAVDAQDLESNLSSLTLSGKQGSSSLATVAPLALSPPSASGTLSSTFVVNTTGGPIVFTAKAQDDTGAFALGTLEIQVAADETEPESAVVSLNASNVYLTAHPIRCEIDDSRALGVNNWFITDPRSISGTWSSFEAETPPVHYKVAVATSPPTSWTTSVPGQVVSDPITGKIYQANAQGKIAVPGAITRNPTGLGWAAPSPDTAESYTFSVDRGELSTTFAEGMRYYIGVQPINSANPPIANRSFGQPRNPGTGCLQNAFTLDATPPSVGTIRVAAQSQCPGPEPFISGLGGLSVEWSGDDNYGSGVSSYSYKLVSQPTGGQTSTIYDVQEHQAAELNNLPIGNQHGRILTLSVKAKDHAGNESTVPSTLVMKVDSFPPKPRTRPVITNLNSDGVITDPNHFEGRWDNVFVDDEEPGQLLSFEWGISTTMPIRGIPDRSGGWQTARPDPGTTTPITFGSLDQTNLLANGDTVYLVVRATNCANSTSIETYSAPAPVRTDLYSRLTPVPPSGFLPLAVDFKLEVIGGAGPFKYTFRFSDKPEDTGSQTVGPMPETSTSVQHTYTALGSHRCFGQVETKADQIPAGLKSFALATIQVLPQPYVLVLGNGSFSVMDLAVPTPLVKVGLIPAGVSPSSMAICDIGDSLKFVLVAASGTGSALGGLYRFDLDSVTATTSTSQVVIREQAGDRLEDLSVSSDFRTVLLTNLAGGSRSLWRLRLDPRINYGANIETPFSLGPDAPESTIGRPVAAQIGPDDSSGIAIDEQGPWLDSIIGLSGPVRVHSRVPLTLTSPGHADLSDDGSLLAVPDRASPNLLLATLATSAGETIMTTSRVVALPEFNGGDVKLAPDRSVAYVAEYRGSRVARVPTGISTAAPIVVTVATGQVQGLDISRDGTLLLVGDSVGRILVRRASTLGNLGALPDSTTVPDGCKGVAFFERPNLGRPVVTGTSPTSVARGSTVDVRGFNLGPIDTNLKVMIESDNSLVPDIRLDPVTPSTGTNGFNSMRALIPATCPEGPATLVVITSQGSSGSLAAGRITVR